MLRLSFLLVPSRWPQRPSFYPCAPQKPRDKVIQVREACGAGMHRVNGVCLRTAARRNAGRAVRRYATGMTC